MITQQYWSLAKSCASIRGNSIQAYIKTEECEQCSSPDDGSFDTVLFSYEIDCRPVCETEAPSNSPSVNNAPSACIESEAPKEMELAGMQNNFTSSPEGLLKITDQRGDGVSFEVNNVFTESVTQISVRYHMDVDTEDCDVRTSFDGTLDFDAFCYGLDSKWTDVSIIVYFGDEVVSEECESCQAPSNDSVDTVYFGFVLPCIPCDDDELHPDDLDDSSLDTPPCYDGVVDITDESGNVCGTSGNVPIQIFETEEDYVMFGVTNTFGVTSDLSIRFDPFGGDGSPECYDSSLGAGGSFVNNMQATCVDGVAKVEVFAKATSDVIEGSQSTMSRCSDDPVDCAHVYLLPCLESRCDNDRRLDAGIRVENSLGSTTYESTTEYDDMPYCLSEDFPCEGEETNMVYVCHYSKRKGYQTFCVPEADSDILRFYAHDYCGPCEGGQGVTWGKMAI
jgi:hypothetical protein